jgi:hypothetical protein
VAEFDQVIPPGGEGRVTIKVSTGGYRGPKQWNAEVYTNDPRWKEFILTVKAYVKPVLTVKPVKVNVYYDEGEFVTREVDIIAEIPRPLTLVPAHFDLGERLTYRIEEIEKGKRFKVIFQNIPGRSGRFRGILRLNTNYPEKSSIMIWVWGGPNTYPKPS